MEDRLTRQQRTAGARQIYSSALMQERRDRILLEARSLLAEQGQSGFNIRELSRRAEVSTRTLYHAFGDKEGILAHAVTAHVEGLRDEWAAVPLGEDLDSLLAEYDRVAEEIDRTSAYTRTLVEIFYSLTPIASALESIRSLPASRMIRWLDQVPRQGIRPCFDRARLIDHHVDVELAAIRRWAVGLVSADALADEMRLGFLFVLLAVTRGQVHADVGARYSALLNATGRSSQLQPSCGSAVR